MMHKQMAKRWRLPWFMTIIIVHVSIIKPAKSNPQIHLLTRACSQFNISSQRDQLLINTNLRDFYNNLNATFADLRSQLSKHGNKHFATAQRTSSSDPIYGMAQCRNYLSSADCVACYDAAVSQIRNCAAANGARAVYDGCFLRYESINFYEETTSQGNRQLCGNNTAPQAKTFQAEAQILLKDLETATPRIKGYFAAVKKNVTGGNTKIYAVAQCAETISEDGCRDCLRVAYQNIKNCLVNADGRAIDAACFMRYSNTPFFADNQTTIIAPFLREGSSSKKKAIIGGVAGGIGFLLVVLFLFIWYQLSRKRRTSRKGNILGATELQGPLIYKYKDLRIATKNFSEENKLGAGGFGEVYKGTLKNGNVVAVKRITLSSNRAKAEFDSEVRLISNVHHRNLTRLLGCSRKGSDLLLVHEYMENGSLDKYLYGEERGTLTWKQRYDIIFGTARGLAYLHDQFHVSIIHRDIKSSNILLHSDFQPKIADFGLATLMPEDRSHLSTRFVGTLGYTAPEYAIHGHLSEKADTYSFGVVVLEIISGRRCNDVKDDNNVEYLLEQAWNLYESGMHLNLVDETLDPNEYKLEEVSKAIEIAVSCTQSPASSRPTMSEVVVMLSSDHAVEQKPRKRPTFIDPQKRTLGDVSTSTASSSSKATESFTEITGR